MMNHIDTWQANWEGDVLHIQGVTDEFPDQFSVPSLDSSEILDGGTTLKYQLAFSRDKEPFCDKDLVGPVHHFERNIPREVKSIKVVGTGNGYAEITVPRTG